MASNSQTELKREKHPEIFSILDKIYANNDNQLSGSIFRLTSYFLNMLKEGDEKSNFFAKKGLKTVQSYLNKNRMKKKTAE